MFNNPGHLIAETNQTGQMLAEYVYLGDQLLSMIKPGEAVYYFHNDHLGTPQVLTDDTKIIAWKAPYTPFGEAVASIQTVENPFRFPGQYYDQETGLHYNYFRYYNPQTGRYITPDPIGLEGGINLFAYVAGNPARWADPRGLELPEGLFPEVDAYKYSFSDESDASDECRPTRCDKSWVECYTNCIEALDPIGNLADRLANFVINSSIQSYIQERLPWTPGAWTKVRKNQAVAGRGTQILAAWQVGTSYGCMISCAADPCSW